MTTAKRNTAKRKSSKPSSAPPGSELATARVHDLVGLAAVALPAELRSIFDDKTYQKIRRDVEGCLMTVIIREPGHIVYVQAHLTALDVDAPAGSAASTPQARGSGHTSINNPTKSSASTTPRSTVSPVSKVAATSQARTVTVSAASATKRSGTQQSPAKRTAKADKSSRRPPEGKA